MIKHKEHRTMCIGHCVNPKYKVKVWNYNPTRYGIAKNKQPASLDSVFLNRYEAVEHIELILKLNPRWEKIQLLNEKGEIIKEWQNKNIGTSDQF